MSLIIFSVLSLTVISLVFGILLCKAGEKFKVETDPRETAVRENLPGANCGACGFAGCDALAAATVKGEAPIGTCTVCSAEARSKIASIMGVEDNASGPKKYAFVKCVGDCSAARTSANYYGVRTCEAAAVNGGKSGKTCQHGCFGFGSCQKVCPFGAILVVNGVAKVDKKKCAACGKCVAACPQHLIDIIPDTATLAVKCSSRDKGPATKAACDLGCIGCGICVKNCEEKAIKVENYAAVIDQSLCKGCGKCAEKCPRKIIRKV